ncbi:hypothetical protein [Spirosoma sp. KNUC1025]|uniref:hypothetical protein n=1 Tax=Spirosoma sp. KNUC1025 TaxID=2894082 RepID=UPI00386A7BAE|nr:hypothetical protein LN737_26720 [Spirosoma sp. KNUC1025]
MKNEERILELLAETLQRIDRHSEQFDRLEAEIKLINERIERQQNLFDRQQEQLSHQQEQLGYQQEQIDEKREQMWTLISQIQKHQEHLGHDDDALAGLRERTEAMHQSSPEQQQAYRAMTELLMHHNRILSAKGIL